jgi:hypothetical protein
VIFILDKEAPMNQEKEKMFSQSIIENLGYYVYLLRDPRTKEVFYVGKGIGNRIFQHLACALETTHENEKLGKIREIRDSGQNVEHFILRHGFLTERGAFEVEAAMIDFIGLDNLSNLQGGHYSGDYGIKSTEEIVAIYEAEKLSIDEPAILININRLYKRDMTSEDLYYATRRAWVVGWRRERAKYAIATYRGLTREVYKIERWEQVAELGPNRWEFHGRLADDEIRKKYRYKNIEGLFQKGAANPIKYMNC